jgi:hypothetical protein
MEIKTKNHHERRYKLSFQCLFAIVGIELTTFPFKITSLKLITHIGETRLACNVHTHSHSHTYV